MYAVYDLGGGTFDMSILQADARACSKCSRPAAIRRSAATISISAVLLCASSRPALRAAVARRRAPAARSRARGEGSAVAARRGARSKRRCPTARSVDVTVDRRDVRDDHARARRARRSAPTRKALRDAKLDAADIKGVVLVGGATRMPQIRRAVERVLRPAAADQSRSGPGRRARRGDPGELLAGNRAAGDDWLLLDVIPLSLGRRDDGRPRREDHSAQLDDSGRARAGVHDVQGRPDGDGDPRRAGRARDGRPIAVRSRASSCAAFRRWPRARRASA